MGEAKDSKWWGGFKKAIDEELKTLEENKTWTMIERRELPYGTNILRSKFVFDIKRDKDGNFIKFKARMVAMGFTQTSVLCALRRWI